MSELTFDVVAVEGAPCDPSIAECRGLIFRGRLQRYLTSRGFAVTSKLDLLKRKSCPGCPKCSWIWDNFDEDLQNEAVQMPKIVDGQLYKLHVTDLGRDYWTGEYDGYEIDFQEVKEPR